MSANRRRTAATRERIGRLGLVARGLRDLRRPADLAVLRAAPTPRALARAALIPAGRNIGLAACLLPAPLREEATATFLACRALDAFEDLGADRAGRLARVRDAVAYLCDELDDPPAIGDAAVTRGSEAVDLLLAERLADLRALVAALPPDGQARARTVFRDVGEAMARNLDDGLARDVYSHGVLGRVVAYACELIATEPLASPELAASVGTLAQMANDLRDGECELYGVADGDELRRLVFLRLPPPALGAFRLLSELGPATDSRGARAATAYMVITTSSFLCREAGARAPYPRPLRLGAALAAAVSGRAWAAVLAKVGTAANEAVLRVLADTVPGDRPAGADGADGTVRLFDTGTTGEVDDAARPSVLCGLLVDTTFRLVDDLPAGRLAGDPDRADVLRVMLADHLAFGALERIPPHRTGEMRELADLIRATATEGATA